MVEGIILDTNDVDYINNYSSIASFGIGSHDNYYDRITEGNLYYGKEKVTWSNKVVYEGDFVKYMKHGKGKVTWSNGGSYIGDFVNGKMHGKGKLTLANGDVYEGDFDGCRKHGKGKYTFKDGRVQKGNWKYGQFKGAGPFGLFGRIRDRN